MERKLVKIVSNNPAHPDGYYTQFKDAMKPGDEEYKPQNKVPVKKIQHKKKGLK